MLIVYCIDSLALSGGTERVLTTKVNWLAVQPNMEVVVVTLKEIVSPFFNLHERVGRVMLEVSRGDIEGYCKELNATLLELKPDIAVATAGMAVNVLYRMTDGSKKVLEFHYTKNFLVNFVKGLHRIRFRQLHLLKMKWLQWKLARTSRKYDLFVGLTQKDVGLWGHPQNMTFVHNPLSFRCVRKSNCLQHKIIAVGSWTPSKGMDQLLEAFGPLAKKYPDWKVELYGSGQEEYLLRDIIAKYDMETQVSLNAPYSDIAKKLVESSIYAFPSRSDGFGLVITEAMECGLPTVAMDCECGPCEIVSDRTGFVVPDRNISAFREALEKLMKDDVLRQKMGRNAVEEVVRFYPDRVMFQWLDLFNRLQNNQ